MTWLLFNPYGEGGAGLAGDPNGLNPANSVVNRSLELCVFPGEACGA